MPLAAAPRLESARASAFPIPDEAPVTHATFPSHGMAAPQGCVPTLGVILERTNKSSSSLMNMMHVMVLMGGNSFSGHCEALAVERLAPALYIVGVPQCP